MQIFLQKNALFLRFLCIFLRFYAILCQKLRNFPQFFAKNCESLCKNFVLVFDFVAVSLCSPAKSRSAPIRAARRGAAAAGRGTERTPSRTPERTPSRREYGVGVCSDCWWCVTERTPDRTAWRPEERKAAPERTPRRTPSRREYGVGVCCVR